MRHYRAIALSLLAAIGLTAAHAGDLSIGSPVPALGVAKWVKGTPVTSFDADKVYVVEFWATWCGPCKQSIPHLTELAKKYSGKVTFSGIDVWEVPNPKDESYFTKVDDFVKEMGPKMDYNVGIDGKAGDVNKAWMVAAGQNGIPTAFVVNKGQIAWIGHPMGDLDKTLGEILEGKYDQAKFAQTFAVEQAKAKAQRDLQIKIAAARKLQDWKGIVKIVDEATAKDRELGSGFVTEKIVALFHVDEKQGLALAKEVTGKQEKGEAVGLGINISETKGLGKGAYIFAAEKIAEFAEVHPKTLPVYPYLARAYRTAGDNAKALAAVNKGIEVAGTSEQAKGFVKELQALQKELQTASK